MYESIDGADSETIDTAAPASQPWIIMIFVLLLTGGMILLMFIYTYQRPAQDKITLPDDISGYEIYLAAMTETDPALRMARLIDFKNTYPQSSRQPSATAQLDVLTVQEAEDWARLTHIIFNPRTSYLQKRAALDSYETTWNVELLGGREDEVKQIRQTIGATEDNYIGPHNSLDFTSHSALPLPNDPATPSLTPDNNSQLAGQTTSPAPADITHPSTSAHIISPPSDVIVPARIRRSRQPKYPSRALRRGIEGEIILKLYIMADGRVQTTELVFIHADGYENDFIRVAERAALKTRFHPKTVNGIAQPDIQDKRYIFKIDP